MPALCVIAVIGIVILSLFFYLLNTARKKTPVNTNVMGKKDFAPVYVSLADKPDSIMRGMDRFAREVQTTEKAGDKWRWIPLIIFVTGVGLMMVDGLLLLLGYFSLVFSAGGFLLWIAAFIMARSLRRSDSLDFSPRYKSTKEILHALRDDLKHGSTFTGHLDLTGALLSTKVAREAKDAQNRTTKLFADPWLSLKAKLYDGNVLRVTAIQKSKKRDSYWKRSRISGKSKLKPEKFKGTEQELKVRIVVNPEVYKIVPNNEFKPGANIGKYTIAQLSTDGGMVNVVATSPFDEVEQSHILGFLKSTYSLLQRKAS
ncbi:MAG: hypothetical protein HYZ23_09240 [Chloroflexi bacterium]|nr:hypothetical protein [Chloroflexota bacterium]